MPRGVAKGYLSGGTAYLAEVLRGGFTVSPDSPNTGSVSLLSWTLNILSLCAAVFEIWVQLKITSPHRSVPSEPSWPRTAGNVQPAKGEVD